MTQYKPPTSPTVPKGSPLPPEADSYSIPPTREWLIGRKQCACCKARGLGGKSENENEPRKEHPYEQKKQKTGKEEKS